MEKPVGPIIGTIIIILILILGAYYIFIGKKAGDDVSTQDVQAIETEIQDIDIELASQEAELNSLEAELEAVGNI